MPIFSDLSSALSGSSFQCKEPYVTCLPLVSPVLHDREALIKSLSAFILGFLCNARNGTTRIASYLRSPMTKQCIKILIKADSMNESVLT